MRRLAKLFVCAQLFCGAGAMAQVPRVLGIWELDLNASELPNGFPVASETRSYDLRDDGYLVNLVIRKRPDGHPEFIQVVFKSDGKDYPQYQSYPLAELQINGSTTRLTYSETVVDENSVNVIAKLDGRMINKGVRTVSADGATMTIEVVAIDQNGNKVPFSLVFKRVGPK